MKEFSIDLSQQEIASILSGKQTQLRRVLKTQPPDGASHAFVSNVGHPWHDVYGHHAQATHRVKCPLGGPGDQLWVKEPWRTSSANDGVSARELVENSLVKGYKRPWVPLRYEFDGALNGAWLNSKNKLGVGTYRSQKNMPRWACRLLLEVICVELQQLHSIGDDGLAAQGFEPLNPQDATEPSELSLKKGDDPTHSNTLTRFQLMWDEINGADSWRKNPFVWAITFRELKDDFR